MAIYVYASGKTYTDVDRVRATVARPELGTLTSYLMYNDPVTQPNITGLSGVLDGRYIHDSSNPWDNPMITG